MRSWSGTCFRWRWRCWIRCCWIWSSSLWILMIQNPAKALGLWTLNDLSEGCPKVKSTYVSCSKKWILGPWTSPKYFLRCPTTDLDRDPQMVNFSRSFRRLQWREKWSKMTATCRNRFASNDAIITILTAAMTIKNDEVIGQKNKMGYLRVHFFYQITSPKKAIT